MKFKILPKTGLFNTLQEVNNGIIAARAAIRDTLISKGFTGNYGSSLSSLYLVSCNAVEIEGEKPTGWKSIGPSWQNLYWPLAKNKKVLEELSSLPKIKNEAINNPLGFSFCVGPNLEIYHRPGILFHKKFILVDTGNVEYQPVADMIEILESEYDKLAKLIKD